MHAFTLFLSGICRPKNRLNHRLLQSIIAEVVNNTVRHREIGHPCMVCFVHQYYERREQIELQTRSNLDTLANLPCTSSRFEVGVLFLVRPGTLSPSRIGWFFTFWNRLSCVWFLSHSLTHFWQSWHPILLNTDVLPCLHYTKTAPTSHDFRNKISQYWSMTRHMLV